MLDALASWVIDRRRVVIGLWIVVAAVALVAATQVGSVLRAGGFSAPGLEAEIALERLSDDLDNPGTPIEILFRSDDLDATDPRFIAAAAAALEPLAALPEVVAVVPHWQNFTQIAPSGRAGYATVFISLDIEEAHHLVPSIRELVATPELETHVAGSAVFYSDIQTLSEGDLRRAELIGGPFALVVLILVFGSIVAAAIPLVAGGATVVLGLAAVWVVGQVTDFSVFALNVVTLVGLGLGADYSLFLVSRFREELRRGREVEDAVKVTMRTAGRAVVYSGLAVLVGLASLSVFEFMMLRSIGIGGAIAVFIAVAAALTLVPAILAELGSNVNRWAVPSPRFRVRDGWTRLAHAVMRRPLPVFLAVSALLILLGVPFLHVRIRGADASVLGSNSPARAAYDAMSEEFGHGQPAPLAVVTRLNAPALAPESIARMHAFGQALLADPRVARVYSHVTIDPRITLEQYQLLYRDRTAIPDAFATATAEGLTNDRTVLMVVEPRASATSDEARELVHAIRAYRDANGLDALVGGGAASLGDFVDRLYGDFPRAVGLILLVTYVALVAQFRSVVLPLKAVVMNVLSLLASFGALVLVFQDGWLENVFRFEPLGFIEATAPIILFAVLFGLSMDYEVFLLSRIKEGRDAGLDNADSVAQGLARSGRVITNAALVVIVVSLAFTSADVVLVKAIGLGAAVAVFVDATIVRSLLVPSTMRLLGRWNWWAPAWLFEPPRLFPR
ncbi:MAG: MMPL family transporter [Chloroflexota bacterium]|nr:MMPL family transporter [Chloroflexota bacterium]